MPGRIEGLRVNITNQDGSTTNLVGQIDAADINALNVALGTYEPLQVRADRVTSQYSFERMKHVIVKDRFIETTETTIGHGLGRVPVYYIVRPIDVQATWIESQPATDTNLYLTASAKVAVEIFVMG